MKPRCSTKQAETQALDAQGMNWIDYTNDYDFMHAINLALKPLDAVHFVFLSTATMLNNRNPSSGHLNMSPQCQARLSSLSLLGTLPA